MTRTQTRVDLSGGLRDYLAGDTIRDEAIGPGLVLTGRRIEAVDPIRVAVIGCGNHSRGALQPNLARLPHFDYVAACDLDAGAAADCARRFGAAASFTDYRAMFDDVKPEAVVVCGPPALHVEAGLEAIRRGVHVFVEKPSAPDLEQAEAFATAADEAGVVGMVGFFWRHAEALHKVADLVADPSFGAPLLYAGEYLSPGPRVAMWGSPTIANSFLTDQAIHIIDATRFLMGDVTELVARSTEGPDGAAGYAVVLRFAGGMSGTLTITSYSNAFTSRLAIHGAGGRSVEVIESDTVRVIGGPALPRARGGYVDQNA
ncbi:MAG TPA: Gfo/Idh/MocA family oxidoreductase, partial [Candidatus Limnocylindrales bacterium]|nr:Gfo/Idh/MocA family oxidoreductase [Candidatus Limnocylindrales bacterium]